MADFGIDVDPGEVGFDEQRLQRIDTQYVVTNQRINIRQGILSRADHATSYERLQNVKVTPRSTLDLVGVSVK